MRLVNDLTTKTALASQLLWFALGAAASVLAAENAAPQNPAIKEAMDRAMKEHLIPGKKTPSTRFPRPRVQGTELRRHSRRHQEDPIL